MRYANHSPSSSAVSLAAADVGSSPASDVYIRRSYLSTFALAILFVALAIVADSVGASDPVPGHVATVAAASR